MNAYVLTMAGEKIPASPKPREGNPNPETFTLEELQDIVGGWIEIVPLSDGVVMVVDEEGKLKDSYLNERATELFLKCHPERRDFITGNVLVCLQEMID